MNDVLCSISTYKRYDTTLPLALMSIINQTTLPNKVVVFDDNDDPRDVRKEQTYQYIFQMMDAKGIQWEWLFAGKRGQHHNHQMANKMGFKWVWRMDDDTVAEPNVLASLLKFAVEDVGAVGGSILTPPHISEIDNATGKIEDINGEPNLQWGVNSKVKEVDHLHCSFLYRAGVVDYNLALSRVAHREETLFTYRLKKAGYALYIIPNCITWHLKNQQGGIRGVDDSKAAMYEHDDQLFRNEVDLADRTIVVLDCGKGDHVVFRHMMGEIKNPIIFTCYPDIVPGRSIEDAKRLFGDISQYNIYAKMDQWGWTGSLLDAFRKMFT